MLSYFLFIIVNMRVVLPSNASLNFFPHNSLSHYTVKLPSALDLSQGRWEVGLAEIFFMKSWFNVQSELTIRVNDNKTKEEYVVTIPPGYYSTPHELCKQLNECVRLQLPKRLSSGLDFSFDSNARILKSKTNVKKLVGVSIQYSEVLRTLLGDKVNMSTCDYTDDYLVCTYRNYQLSDINAIMVYSDVVSTSIVGDVETNLLRSTAVSKGSHWEMETNTFTPIQYLPVSRTKIDTIEVLIYTDYGEKVPFTAGRTVVTLDFRRVHPLLMAN